MARPEHCPYCGNPLEKIAHIDVGEAWLFWGCPEFPDHWPDTVDEHDEFGIDWPYEDDNGNVLPANDEKLRADGFRIV